MVIVNPARELLLPRGQAPAARTSRCSACDQTRDIDQFELVGEGRRRRRRRVCAECIARVDELVARNAAASFIVATVGVTKETVADRRLALDVVPSPLGVQAAATERFECRACQISYPASRYSTRVNARGQKIRRLICDLCFEQVDKLLREETPVPEIARATGVSAPTVRARAEELGVRGATVRRRTSADEAQLILELAHRDTEPAAIATSTGVKLRTVRRHLADAGIIEIKPRVPISEERLNQAQLLLEDGATYAEVARTTGVDQKVLSERFPGFGATREHRSLVAWINRDEDRKRMQREIDRMKL